MKHRLITAFFLFFLAASLIAADGWQVKDAVLRISTPVRQDTEARFFIPMPTDGDYNCDVFNADGAPGSATVIHLDNATLGFRVVIPPAKANNKHAFIYLSSAKVGAQAAQATEDERPFKVTRNVRTVTTRAFTAKEIMGYFGELQKSVQFSYVKNAGEIPAVEQWQLPEKTHIAALLQWETLFVLSKDAKLSFGSKQPNIAWTMLIDGKAVADWHASEQEKDGSFCAPVEVSKGLHTFQMLVIQRFGEPLPQALMKDADGVRQLAGVSAPDFPSKVTVEFADKEKPVAKASREWPRAYGSITTANDGCMGNAVAFAKTTVENVEFTDLEGRAIALADSTLIWDASFMPGVRVGAFHFPARCRFMPARQIFIRPRITNAPNVLPFGKELELDVAVDAANEAETVLKFADASMSYRDRNGVIEMPQSVQPLGGQRKLLFKVPSMDAFEKGGRLPTAIDVNISFFSGRLLMAVPATLALVHPQDDAVTELIASGVCLYHGDTPATLVCSRLPKEPLAAKRGVSDKGRKFRCLLLDSFTEDVFAPNASAPLDGLLAKELDGVVEFGEITVGKQEGTSPNVTMLASFGKLLSAKPDIALLLNGMAVTKSFESPMEATAASLFMVQACIAHGILPILVTMPKLPGVDASAIRLEALYLKEMATAMGVPIVDFYSMDINGTVKSWQWYNDTASRYTTATPNDEARDVLATALLIETLKNVLHK